MTAPIFREPPAELMEAAAHGAWDASGSADAAKFGLIAAWPLIVREIVAACGPFAERAFYEGYVIGKQVGGGARLYFAGGDPHRHSTALSDLRALLAAPPEKEAPDA